MALAWLGLGGNEKDPPQQFAAALQALRERDDTEVLAVSPLYYSTAVGPPQPDYLNACARVRTDLQPQALRLALKRLEADSGRRPGGDRWGPRPLDLDILLYDNLNLDEPGLQIPHAEVHNRRFVLQPLLDLDPELKLPDGRSLRPLLERAPPCDLRPCRWKISINGPEVALSHR